MNKEKMQEIGIDYEEGVKRFAGHANLYEKYVMKFVDDPSYPSLVQAMESGETENAFKASHALKGIAGNLSFHCIMKPLVPLVEALRSGDMGQAKELYPDVQNEYEKVCAFLREQ